MRSGLVFFVLITRALAAWSDQLPVVTLAPHRVDLSFPAEAIVEAVRQATVAAQVPGRIVEVRADAGQAVKKGDLLMRIDVRESTEAVRAAEARYLDAKAAYERASSLQRQGFISQAAVDRARADVDAAAANRSAASIGRGHGDIVAPLSGIISRRHAEFGEMAAPGKALLTLYEPDALRVTAYIPQYRLREMRDIRGARVEFPELGTSITASSVTLLPTVDSTTHVSQVRVHLPAEAMKTATIMPGMFTRVHFVVGQAEKLTLPAKAVLRRGEVTAVYVRAADNRLSLRQVRLGENLGNGELEILSGLAVGETVVTDPTRAAIALKAALAPDSR